MSESLNFIDYLVIVILLLSTTFAFIRGFIGSFLSLVGWVLAIYLTYTTFPYLKPLIEEKIKNPILILVIGHTALLIGFLILFGIFNLFALTAVKGMGGGVIDRSLGALFGIIRGLIITSFIFLIVSTSFAVFNGTDTGKEDPKNDETLPNWITVSKSYPILRQGKDILVEFIPDSFYEKFQEMYNDVSKKTINERFMETISQKLQKNLSPKQISAIDKYIKGLELTHSDEEIQNKKLQKLFEAYNNSPHQPDSRFNLKKDEVNKINKILQSKEKNVSNDADKEINLQDPEPDNIDESF